MEEKQELLLQVSSDFWACLSLSLKEREARLWGVGHGYFPFLSSVFSSSDSSFFILSCSNWLYPPLLQAWLLLKHFSMWPSLYREVSVAQTIPVFMGFYGCRRTNAWSLTGYFSQVTLQVSKMVCTQSFCWESLTNSSCHCWPAFFVCSSFLGRIFLGAS